MCAEQSGYLQKVSFASCLKHHPPYKLFIHASAELPDHMEGKKKKKSLGRRGSKSFIVAQVWIFLYIILEILYWLKSKPFTKKQFQLFIKS